MEDEGKVDRAMLLRLAKSEIAGRNLRGRYLPKGFFGEPAWQMLLELYIDYCEYGEGHGVAVTSLCIASGEPQTTALRWIAILEDHDLLRRSSDHSDRRRRFIFLTDKGRHIVDAYFAGKEVSQV